MTSMNAKSMGEQEWPWQLNLAVEVFFAWEIVLMSPVHTVAHVHKDTF